MLERIKLALRISHSYLDGEIESTIATARAEMIRSGISPDKANDDTDDLITQCIKTYCLYIFASSSEQADGYFKSWQYQLDNIRKST